MRNLQITVSMTERESAATQIYFNEVAKTGMITAGEEVILAQKIRNGDKAALDRLVKANLRFVVSVAKKYQRNGMPLGDLINEGNLGLIKAASRFDETRGFKFISFAVWWIRQSIRAAIAEHERIVRLPLNVIAAANKINQSQLALEGLLERTPTDEELAEFTGINLAGVSDARTYWPKAVNLDKPLSPEEDYALIDKMGSNAEPADCLVAVMDSNRAIAPLLGVLTARERAVVEYTFGFKDGRTYLNREIAVLMGHSLNLVRHIQQCAMAKLKAAAQKPGYDFFNN